MSKRVFNNDFAVTGYMGVGTYTPLSALHVIGNRNNNPSVKGIHIGEGGTNDYAIEICAANSSSSSYIDFTYPNRDFSGRILYGHSNNEMLFFTDSSLRMVLSGTGALSLTNTINIGSVADSSSSTSGGAFTCAGGGAFAKSVYVGSNVTTSIANVTSTADSSSSVAGGAFTCAGGGAFAKSVYMGANLNVTSNNPAINIIKNNPSPFGSHTLLVLQTNHDTFSIGETNIKIGKNPTETGNSGKISFAYAGDNSNPNGISLGITGKNGRVTVFNDSSTIFYNGIDENSFKFSGDNDPTAQFGYNAIINNWGQSTSARLAVQDRSGTYITFNNTSGSITANGGGVSYNTSSDYRLKENIVPLTKALSRIIHLPVYQFNYIDSKITMDGFLAHEVQMIIPEAVTGEKDDINDDKSIRVQQMDASKIIPLLTAAIKELIAENNIMKEQIASIQEQMFLKL
jgi:Chaperone of endosialidase